MLRIDFRKAPAIGPGLVVGFGLALGGCSADFLRFDSPVFGLNGDTGAVNDTAVAPTGDTLYTQRTAATRLNNSSGDYYAPPPVASVARSVPPPDISQSSTSRYEPTSRRVAAATPIVETPAYNADDRSSPRKSYVPTTTGALPSRGEPTRGESVTVQRGDSLYAISRRHGVSIASLREANGLRGNVIQPGQRLVLPGAGGGRTPEAPIRSTASRYNPNSSEYQRPSATRSRPSRVTTNQSSGDTYTVRRGDSLYAISRRTGVSVATLKRTNGITDVRALRPGQRLALGGEAGPSATTQVASRSDYTASSRIKAKPITTVPIVRGNAPSTNADAKYQPRILNQRPKTGIATKPETKVARAPVAAPATKFRWPARGRVIASFNNSGQGVKNDGINIALPIGTDIAAAEGGVVAYAGSELKGYGNLVLLRHDNGWVSAYAHASEVLVKRGDRINRGQIIAKAGRSGEVTQPQLHFELRKGAKPIDPMPHLAQL